MQGKLVEQQQHRMMPVAFICRPAPEARPEANEDVEEVRWLPCS